MTRILVVDDSATIRKMVRASLQELCPAEFAEAASGLEAIEQLAISNGLAAGARPEHAGHARY